MAHQSRAGRRAIVRHMISLSYLLSLILPAVYLVLRYPQRLDNLLYTSLSGLLFAHPLVLTGLNLFFFLFGAREADLRRKGRHIACLTLVEGGLYTELFLPLMNVTASDWTETLVNQQLHTPLWSGGWVTTAVLCAVGLAGGVALACLRMDRTPPLVTVCAMAGLYLGLAECAVWTAQVFRPAWENCYLCLLPVNCLLLGAALVRGKAAEWRASDRSAQRPFRHPWLERPNAWLMDAARWPAAAFLLMWPLLGLLTALLVLLGQQPDAAVRAWTETSDWNLSRQTAPPNLYYDEHYLCTVAAGGHRRLVRPLRMGQRHGHRVIVNRQLCIANAFEELLWERTPRLHRRLRGFYDRYGLPVARLIRSPWAADAVYLLMKPAEWLFLTALYLCDVHPEDRIAVQYLPRPGRGAKKRREEEAG